MKRFEKIKNDLIKNSSQYTFTKVSMYVFDKDGKKRSMYEAAPCYAQLCSLIKAVPDKFEYAICSALTNYQEYNGKGVTNNALLHHWVLNEQHSPFKNMLTIIKDYLEIDEWKDFVNYCLTVGLVIPKVLCEQFSAAAIMALAIPYRLQYSHVINDYMKKMVQAYPNIPPGFIVWWGLLTGAFSTSGYKPFAVTMWSNHKNVLGGNIEPTIPDTTGSYFKLSQELPLMHKDAYWTAAGMPVYSYFTKNNINPEKDIYTGVKGDFEKAREEVLRLVPTAEQKTKYGKAFQENKIQEVWDAYQKAA